MLDNKSSTSSVNSITHRQYMITVDIIIRPKEDTITRLLSRVPKLAQIDAAEEDVVQDMDLEEVCA